MEWEGKGGVMKTDPVANCLPSATPANTTTDDANVPGSTMEKVPAPATHRQSLDTNAAIWGEYYGATTHPSIQTIFTVSAALSGAESSVYKCDDVSIWKESSARRDHPIIIDSGASQSVVGKAWLIHHRIFEPSHWRDSKNDFRFGSGPSFSSCGYVCLGITIPATATQSKNPIELNIQADVVDAPGPFLISLRALQSLSAQIDFRNRVLIIPAQGWINCEHSPSGHLLLPVKVESVRNHPGIVFVGSPESPNASGADHSGQVEPRKCTLPNIQLNEGRQMGHCSKASLLKLLQASKRIFAQSQLDQVYAKCKCQHTVDRIAPPLAPSVLARRAGEIVDVDICYPFVRVDIERQDEAKNYKVHTNFHIRLAALIMVCALTRFTVFPLLRNLTGGCAAVAFMNDWVRVLGKPRRLISDSGGPGFTGAAWASLGNISGRQDVRAPAGAAYQNGMCE